MMRLDDYFLVLDDVPPSKAAVCRFGLPRCGADVTSAVFLSALAAGS
jgi:hypothetical protein